MTNGKSENYHSGRIGDAYEYGITVRTVYGDNREQAEIEARFMFKTEKSRNNFWRGWNSVVA